MCLCEGSSCVYTKLTYVGYGYLLASVNFNFGKYIEVSICTYLVTCVVTYGQLVFKKFRHLPSEPNQLFMHCLCIAPLVYMLNASCECAAFISGDMDMEHVHTKHAG